MPSMWMTFSHPRVMPVRVAQVASVPPTSTPTATSQKLCSRMKARVTETLARSYWA